VNLVFTDAGYWVALRHQTDQNHGQAGAIAKRLLRERCGLVTTPFVFAEVYATFSRMPQRRQQVVRDIWHNPVVQVEQVNYEDQQSALDLLRSYVDKSFSFTDALSFVVMKRLGLKKAVSFDGHFRQMGHFEIIDAG